MKPSHTIPKKEQILTSDCPYNSAIQRGRPFRWTDNFVSLTKFQRYKTQ